MTKKSPVVFLMGPTASGKTGAAFALVEKFPFEIISVDSALVYRGMDIGTSKPTHIELARAPHHLIDICDPIEHYSAARFRQDALRLIEEVFARGKIPLFVGGTMLYFRALQYGMSELPEGDETIRQQLDEIMMREGLEVLYSELQDVDPIASASIKSSDKQRIQRALEVFRLTGKPISYWWQQSTSSALPYQLYKTALVPSDRRLLHRRIESRFDEMLHAGLIEEVKTLYSRGDLTDQLPSIRSVGYRQVWQMLEGQLSYSEMREKAITATRQLAKRQLTWLRSETDLNVVSIDDEYFFDTLLKKITTALY